MKIHSDNFKETIKSLGKMQDVRITYTLNNKQFILDGENINSATPNYEASLLKSVMKGLDLDSNVDIPLGTEIKFEYGLLVNGVYEYLNYGNYIVYSSEKQEDTLSYKITCYDKMLYSMKDYEHIDIPYPCTIKQYLVALCNKIGLQFKDSDFANANRQITSELFMTINEDGTYSSMGYTYRDVLDQIAETTGGCICLTLDDKVEVRYINKALEYSTSKNTNEVKIETQVKEKVKTINIDGNSYQETTEGYNLLNVPSEYTVLITEAVKKVPISLKANHTYTIKIGQINTDNTDVTSVLFRFTYNKVDISNSYVIVKLSDLKKVYTPACDIDDVFIYSGNSYAQSAKTNTTYKNLMIYEGIEDKPYEPYTGGIPSPSPDYPQEITNVGEYDNLFDKNNIISGSYVSDGNGAFVRNSTSKRTDYIGIQANSYYHIYSDKTSGNLGAWYDKDKKFISGITLGGKKEGVVNSPANAKYIAFTISYQGNLTDYSKIKINETAIKIKQSGKNLFDKSTANIGKTISAQGELQGDSGGGFSTSDYIQIEPNTNYYLYNVLPAYYVRTCGIYDDNKGFIKAVALPGSKVGNLLILTPANAKYIRITYKNSDVDIVQVTKGTNLLPYEPYHEPIITPINLQGNILSKVGDVKDILRVDRNGEVEIKKNIGKVVLDGTENWVTLTAQKGDNTSYFYYAKTDMKKASSIICNQFINRAVWSTDVEGIQSITDNLIRLRINTSRASTVAELKTWLAAQKEAGTPVIVYYELATPQIIKLPSISPIELWQGTNIFSLVTNLDTEIELEYPTNYDTINEEYINDTNVNFGEKYRTY